MNIIKATVIAPNAHIAIAVARFNNFINERLLEGAIDILKRIGQVKDENITVVWIPGAYELPLTVSTLVSTDKYHAIIALGTIVRGDTEHFKYIASSTNNGLTNVSKGKNIPVSFGILVTENIEQAIERAGSKMGNKGAEAALTALEMTNVLKSIRESNPF